MDIPSTDTMAANKHLNRLETQAENCDKQQKNRTPTRRARLVRRLDFLAANKNGSYCDQEEARYSEFPPSSTDTSSDPRSGPVYDKVEHQKPVFYKMPEARNHSIDSRNYSIGEFDKKKWLSLFNANIEHYMRCLKSTNGTLRNSVILHLNEEIIPKFVLQPALDSGKHYEKSRQILTQLACYRMCSMVMTHALQALHELTTCDPLTPESARGIQECEHLLRHTMSSERIASESLPDLRQRVNVYGHVLSFIIMHYSRGNFTTYPSLFDIRSFDSIHKTLQDILRNQNDTKLEVIIGFTSLCLMVARYPKGKFKRCCDTLGKSLRSLDDIIAKGEKMKHNQEKELYLVADAHTSYGVILFLMYLSIKIKNHCGNAYTQLRILQMLQNMLQYKITEMINKRPWKSGSIREKKKDWVFLFCGACVLTKIANDSTLSRELRICSVVESASMFSLSSFFTNIGLQRVNGYKRGVDIISELCKCFIYSDINVISNTIGQLLLIRNEEFQSNQLRDEVNKWYLCCCHSNIGLDVSDVLHEGDHSVVYKATVIGAKQSVIVKLGAIHSVQELYITDTPCIRRLRNEINILSNLQHINILPILAYRTVSPPVHYISILASHGTLLRYLRTNRNRNIVLPQQMLLKVAMDTALAVQYLGQNNVVHRNIMARKVLIGQENGDLRVLLSGFEYAVKLGKDIQQHVGRLDESIAVFWSAPESLTKQRFSLKSDVWMYGVLCYEIFTSGCEPYQEFSDLSVDDIMFKIVNHRLRFKRHPCMNHSLFELLMTCMDNDPLRRPDMVTIHRRLDEITDNTNTYPSETTDQHHHGHSDDEYVYCTKNNQKNPSHCKDVDSHIQGLELTKNRRESPYKEVELPYKELDLPYKLKGLETLYRKSYHMTSHPPPPDLLPTGHHTRALLIKEDIVDIDHIIMKQDKLECDEKSLTPEDKPEVFGQVIENSMDTTPNCLSEKLPDGMGDFYLQDVMPSINCCTYVTEVKGLMYERKYLLTEYLCEGDLGTYLLSKRCTSVDQMKHFAMQISSGLYELHENDFIHRDLRLQHVYVGSTQEGAIQVKIGRLCRIKQIPVGCMTHFCQMEQDSLHWSAPEVISYGAYSKASDVYSLGCVLWQLYLHYDAAKETPMLRLIPYCTVTHSKVLESIKQRKFPGRPPSCPMWMYALIRKCWSLSPQHRPDVASIMRDIVQEYTNGDNLQSHSNLNEDHIAHYNRPLPLLPESMSDKKSEPIYETIPANNCEERLLSTESIPMSWICAEASPSSHDNQYLLPCEPHYNTVPCRPAPLPGKITRAQSLRLRMRMRRMAERAVNHPSEEEHYQIPRQFSIQRTTSNETGIIDAGQINPKPPGDAPRRPYKSSQSRDLQRECIQMMKKYAPLPSPPEIQDTDNPCSVPAHSREFARSVYQNYQPHYENLPFQNEWMNYNQPINQSQISNEQPHIISCVAHDKTFIRRHSYDGASLAHTGYHKGHLYYDMEMSSATPKVFNRSYSYDAVTSSDIAQDTVTSSDITQDIVTSSNTTHDHFCNVTNAEAPVSIAKINHLPPQSPSKSTSQSSSKHRSSSSAPTKLKTGFLPSPSALRRSLRKSLQRSRSRTNSESNTK